MTPPLQARLTYTAIQRDGLFYAVLPRGEEIGPYETHWELIRDMEQIEKHLAGCFAGAK